MGTSGYLMLDKIECVYFEKQNTLLVIPTDKKDMPELRRYLDKRNYYLKYDSTLRNTGIVYAYIIDVQMEFKGALRLTVKHYFRIIPNDGITGFDIISDEIDDFFNPVDIYFFKKDQDQIVDLRYTKDLIDNFNFIYADKRIEVALHVGDVLSRGVASDLMLHPVLRVSFEKTDDLEFIYSIYCILINAIKILRHNRSCNIKSVTLNGYRNGEFQKIGEFNENSYIQERSTGSGLIKYIYVKSHISAILQLVTDNYDDTYLSFPDEDSLRYKYDIPSFVSVWGAFERECHKKPELYETASDAEIIEIKNKIIREVKTIQKGCTSAERQFISDSVQAISRLWTQLGQKTKIINAYKVLEPALSEESIDWTLWRDGLKERAPEERVRNAAGKIVDLRGKIVHGEFFREFSDEENQYIRLIDILSYEQLLKRAGISDNDIEIIIGATYYCNSKCFDIMANERIGSATSDA